MIKIFNFLLKDFFLTSNFYLNLINFFKNQIILKKINKNYSDNSDFNIKNSEIKEKSIYYNYGSKSVKEYYYNNLFYNNFFLNIDVLWSKFFSLNYKFKSSNNIFRSYYRILSTKQGFYFNFLNLKNNKFYLNFLSNTFLSGFKFIWLGVRFWIFPLIILFLVIYFTLVFRALPFNKVMLGWICILMFVYWLLSGFVFFFKKYQFGKYTTAVQRFWRRSYILFWMIEGGTFLVFLYLTFNSSQESFYMYDQINVFKTHLYSWKYFLLKIFPLIILILSTYLLIIITKWNLYSKQSLILLLLTFFLSYLVWLEFYQFFHVLNFYGNLNWIYDVDDHTWSLELEPRRTRIVNHYVMLLFILKFWHIIFIYGFWIFFVLRCWETKRIRYPLLAANFQNFIILYIFAWVFMYPWFKFYLRKFLDVPYYWFYINNRKIFFRVFFNDVKIFYYSICYLYSSLELNFLTFFKKNQFFYWKLLDFNNNFENYKKSIIKDKIVFDLINYKKN